MWEGFKKVFGKEDKVRALYEDIIGGKRESGDIKFKSKKDNLKEEAKKYKTVEDFIENQPKVFHGTDSDFTYFESKFLGSANGTAPINMTGFNFTSNKDVASTFGKNLIEAKVDIKNPYIIDAKGKNYSEFKGVLNEKLQNINSKKYDGIIIKNYKDAGKYSEKYVISDHYIPFNETQIKTKQQLEQIWEKAHVVKFQKKQTTSLKQVRDSMARKLESDIAVQDELLKSMRGASEAEKKPFKDKIKELKKNLNSLNNPLNYAPVRQNPELKKLKGKYDEFLHEYDALRTYLGLKTEGKGFKNKTGEVLHEQQAETYDKVSFERYKRLQPLVEKAHLDYEKKKLELMQEIEGKEGTAKELAEYAGFAKSKEELSAKSRKSLDEIKGYLQKNYAERSDVIREELNEMYKRMEQAIVDKNIAKYDAEQAIKQKEQLLSVVKKIRLRRQKVNAIKKYFQLSDADFRKVKRNRDIRLMTQKEFDEYLDNIQKRAEDVYEHRQALGKLEYQVYLKEYQKTDNLRKAMDLPTLNKMTTEQIKEFSEALEPFKKGDTFLGPRMIQTVKNTDLGEVKTVREIKEKLAEETGLRIEKIDDVRGGWFDDFNYDSALAESNPLYKIMVTDFTAKQLEGQANVLEIKEKIDELAKKARASRKRGMFERFVQQDKLVFDWLNSDAKQKLILSNNMMKEEIDFAHYVRQLFMDFRDRLVEKKTLEKYREDYITHVQRGFFETWKDDGLVKAVKEFWEAQTDAKIDFDAFGDTGEVLGLEKFFKYAMRRSGELRPTKNVAKAVMAYTNGFYKKEALDAIIPKIEAYTFSLQNDKLRTPVVKNGDVSDVANVDGKLRIFVKKWLNNKKGRKHKFMVSQGSKVDSV